MTIAANDTWTNGQGYGFNSGNLADKSVTGINTTFNGLNGSFPMLEQGAGTALASLPAVKHRLADASGKKH